MFCGMIIRFVFKSQSLCSHFLHKVTLEGVSIYLDMVSVMAAYSDLFIYSELYTHTQNGSEYAAITPTWSMSMDTIESFL